MTKTTFLISFAILGCQYVRGIVLQNPQRISRPLVNSAELNRYAMVIEDSQRVLTSYQA